MADDKRWMIRGVDREIRKAVKNAAKTEGVSVGVWVRRAIERGLEVAAKRPAGDLSEHVHLLEARLNVLERSHRNLHQKFSTAARPSGTAANRNRSWKKPIRKSK
jgi:hypothetical protein